jgi:two-component system response regulator MprA
MRVLIVEDDRKMAGLLQKGLEEEGYGAAVAQDGVRGLESALSHAFDVVILDVMLPGIDGVEITRRLRAAKNAVPILMLTGRDANTDIVRGLDAGADDYLTKPFSFEVLLARIRALARRTAGAPHNQLRFRDLVMDVEAHEVRRAGSLAQLTRTEFAILECLLRRAGRVVPRDALIQDVWGYDRDVESNTLDVFMRLLRTKVDAPGRPRLIQTVRGIGYALREGEER